MNLHHRRCSRAGRGSAELLSAVSVVPRRGQVVGTPGWSLRICGRLRARRAQSRDPELAFLYGGVQMRGLVREPFAGARLSRGYRLRADFAVP